jgi:hypothetical protein
METVVVILAAVALLLGLSDDSVRLVVPHR